MVDARKRLRYGETLLETRRGVSASFAAYWLNRGARYRAASDAGRYQGKILKNDRVRGQAQARARPNAWREIDDAVVR